MVPAAWTSSVQAGHDVLTSIPRTGQAETRRWSYLGADGGRHRVLLTATALRRHDTEAVRALIPLALAAARTDPTYVALTMAAQTWLAWQDGHPDEVIALAGRLAEFDLEGEVVPDRPVKDARLLGLIGRVRLEHMVGNAGQAGARPRPFRNLVRNCMLCHHRSPCIAGHLTSGPRRSNIEHIV